MGKFSKYEEWKSGLEEGKNPCYKCQKSGGDRSGDNFHYYGEGKGGHCFSCNHKVPSDEYLELMGVNEDNIEEEIERMSTEFSKEKWDKFKKCLTFNGGGYRGISTAANKMLGAMYEYSKETGELVAQHCIITKDYQMSGLKSRRLPKKFGAAGEVGTSADFFGQWRFKDKPGNRVIVGAGEVDALSIVEILLREKRRTKSEYDIPPVVSPTVGESSCAKQMQLQYDFFDSYERIYICMDSDKAGREAVEKIAKVLPKNKLYVIKLGKNDTNEYIWNNSESVEVDYTRDWMTAYWKAERYVPGGVKGSSGLLGKMRDAQIVPKIPLPGFMSELQVAMRGGIPLGKIINIGSASGTGKSTIIDEFIYSTIFNSEHGIGILTLEADEEEYGTNLLSRHIGRKINLIACDEEREELLNSEFVTKMAEELFTKEDGAHRFYLVDDRDGGLDSVKVSIEKLVIGCDCKIVVIDPLQDLLGGVDIGRQEEFLSWMKGMNKSHKVTFININHVRKSGGGLKANSTGAELFEEDFMGTSSIFKSGACNLLFTRDKESDCPIERNTTYLKATKLRWTGITGTLGEYYYNNEEHKMYDRKTIPGMPIGRPPAPDKDGKPTEDKRPRVGSDGQQPSEGKTKGPKRIQ